MKSLVRMNKQHSTRTGPKMPMLQAWASSRRLPYFAMPPEHPMPCLL
jgi:hypothetical protein